MLAGTLTGVIIMALKPENPVVGGTALRRQSIRSPNYVPGVSGWTINQDGSVEFNNGTFRGVIVGGQLFIYNGTPAFGNQPIASVTSQTADPFGNPTQPGITSYSNANVWAQLQSGILNFQSAAGQPVPGQTVSAAAGAIAVSSGSVSVADSIAQILLESKLANDGVNRLVELIGEQLSIPPTILAVVGGTVTIQNSMIITGTLSVNGSANTGVPSNNNTSQNGLTDGTINGTSGAASAGTAHTHGAGSFAVANGQHTHNLSSHTHVL